MWKFLHRLALAALFIWAVPRHDAFIFGFRTSFFRLRSLPILRWCGKKVIFVFNGSDARPPYIDGADMDPAGGLSIDDCIDLTRAKKRQIAQIERWSTAVVSHALYLHLFERPAAGFQVLGLAQPLLADYPAVAPEPPEPPIRILHSPSNPTVKGTEVIRAAVERLIEEGLSLELIDIRDMPNRVVHEQLRDCHFVVDQLYSDGPMLGFAAEAALYGKPAIVGSYGWDEIARLMPIGHRAPVEGCHPDDIESAIRRLATDAAHRRSLGLAARRFVEDWTGEAVARRYLRLLNGERPPDWMCSPSEVRYVQGVGLSEQRAREIVSAVIRKEGIGALQIGDKPALEAAFRKFVSAPEP
jgi:glycosyltransferase involved in cell wall biosynthesis